MLLVLATRNRKKRQEIVDILGDLPLEFGDLAAGHPFVAEDDEALGSGEHDVSMRDRQLFFLGSFFALGTRFVLAK